MQCRPNAKYWCDLIHSKTVSSKHNKLLISQWYRNHSWSPVPGDVLCSGLFNCRQAAFCCSAVRHQLAVPSHRLSTYGRRAFAKPARRRGTHCQHTFVAWRPAPLHLDDYLRLICFLSTSVYSALGVSAVMRYINRRFTYLLTLH